MIEKSGQKVFLVGVGRSGTSLLQAMLNAHAEVVFLPETGFIRNYVFTGKIARALKLHGISGLKDCLADDARIKRLGPNMPEEVEKHGLLNSSTDFAVADKCIYEFLHVRLHSSITGDKDPKLIEYIDVLKVLWPSSKIIHVYRDPRDVFLSKKKARWSQSQSNVGRLVANVAQFKMAANAENRLGRSQVHTVRYESLINSPESVLRGVCEWLDIEFEDMMLAHQKTAKDLVFEDEIQWKSEVLEPVMTNNSGKWQTGLSTFDAEWAARCSRGAMKAGGYDTQPSSHGFTRAGVVLLSMLVIGVAKAYTVYRSMGNLWLKRKLEFLCK